MQTELLTGTPGNVTAEAKKLLKKNPNWQVGEFGACADSKGNARVALAMHLEDSPSRRISDLTITTGTEKTVKAKATKLAKEHVLWSIRRICPYFTTSEKRTGKGDKQKVEPTEEPCAAILFTLG